ncbi:hypothetical protein BGX38DRAFT_13818 [Terfezia claveryi]|nr:hypothetical protein BGX38DRAFT_13818 [Terfezia claveryi]
MAMAEVAAANPSHTSAAGSTVPVPAVANSASSKSPTISPLSTPHANPLDQQAPHTQAHHRQQQLQQPQRPPQKQQRQQKQQKQQHHHQSHPRQQPPLPTPQYTTASPPGPGDANTTSTFPPHWSQPGQMQFSSPSRGLPPIMSPMMGISGGHDMRQPVSPRTVPLSMGDSGQDLSALPGDLTAPRKRSKVSRACDECRRKKIRCDATSESGIEQCSSCKRVGSKCSFSRVPMKRGPSKGYGGTSLHQDFMANCAFILDTSKSSQTD